MAKELNLSSYVPNLKNSRVTSVIARSIDWCERVLSPDWATPVHTNTLREVFGSSKDVSAWLKANLLIQSGQYEVGKKSFEYTINADGMKKVKALIPTQAYIMLLPIPSVEEKYASEVLSGNFSYSTKSDRYWHPLQNMKREKKREFWTQNGYCFDYDINACAPTILIQLATKMGLHPLASAPIRDYLDNKCAFRERIAALVDISYDDAKRLINSLFNGARLAANPHCAAFRLLGSTEKMRLVQNDHQVKMLRTAIKSMWSSIDRKTARDVSTSSGKWALYFRWERLVLDVIKRELDKMDLQYFTEHDGFRTTEEVDVTVLETAIKTALALEMKVERVMDSNNKQQHTLAYVATKPNSATCQEKSPHYSVPEVIPYYVATKPEGNLYESRHRTSDY